MAVAAPALPLPAPFAWRDGHVRAELPGASVLFTTRRGGVSSGPYASLNLGRYTDDDPAAVTENHRRVAVLAGTDPERVLHGHQVHGTHVRRTTEPTRAGVEDADGQATTLERHPALVVAADCLPVLLVAPGAVAALHAGWRGLAAGILAEGVAALRELGAAGPVRAMIGPGARGCCYEVGEEVHAAFAADGARVGERNLDLARVARRRLRAAGADAVHDTGLCTMCHPELFFSHRRERSGDERAARGRRGLTGRQAGVVWRA